VGYRNCRFYTHNVNNNPLRFEYNFIYNTIGIPSGRWPFSAVHQGHTCAITTWARPTSLISHNSRYTSLQLSKTHVSDSYFCPTDNSHKIDCTCGCAICFQCLALSMSSDQDWIVQCFTSPPTKYRLYGRRFLQVKRPNHSIKVLREMLQRTKQTTKTTKYTSMSSDQSTTQRTLPVITHQYTNSPEYVSSLW